MGKIFGNKVFQLHTRPMDQDFFEFADFGMDADGRLHGAPFLWDQLHTVLCTKTVYQKTSCLTTKTRQVIIFFLLHKDERYTICPESKTTGRQTLLHKSRSCSAGPAFVIVIRFHGQSYCIKKTSKGTPFSFSQYAIISLKYVSKIRRESFGSFSSSNRTS